MRRWGWFFASFLLAVIFFSIFRTPAPTLGAQLLAAIDTADPAHPLRRAVMLIDYTPDDDLVAAVHDQPITRGLGNSPSFNLATDPPPGQQWFQGRDFTFTWHPPASTNGLLHSVHTAHTQLATLLATTRLNDAFTPAALDAASKSLDRLLDESLFLAWMNADRGVLAETNDPQQALQQALLVLARPGTDPILTFPLGHRRIYILPGERIHSPRASVWCELQAYDADNTLLWTALLRVEGNAPAEHLRTLAAALAADALRPIPKAAPDLN